MKVDLFLFDDRVARSWRPFHLTRPIGELLFGCLLLRERAERCLGSHARGYLAGRALLGFEERDAPPVLDTVPSSADEARVFLSSRFVPEAMDLPSAAPATLLAAGEPVGWVVPPGDPAPTEEHILDPRSAPGRGEALELGGLVLEWPWSLVQRNGDRIDRDVSWLFGETTEAPAGVVRLGQGALSLGEGVEVEPGVVLDMRRGPIRLDDGVTVQGPARLSGPLYLGRATVIFGGSVGASSLGPVCKVRGEVDSSVLTGYCNKAHDGYLGHALLGRWVNLGALTTNSDLKNN
jgi:hypothetical protein